LDPDGIVTHWGDGVERIKQWKPEEIVGQHLRVLYPAEEPPEDGTAEDHLRHAAAHGEYIGEGRRRRKNGELFQARVVLTALRRDGELVGFSKIAQDLTGEREHHLALEAAMRAAQAASVAKSQFLANTSHEIRTPLNAIMGYAELLEMGLAGALSPQQRQYVSRIQRTSGHLLALINDVLDLSRIEAGHVNAVREPGSVHEVVSSALLLVEPQVRARRIALGNACGDATAYRGDPERVRQILANLLSNAVRFTEPGGRVTVTCGTLDHPAPDASLSHAGPVTFIKVEDTGVGILPDQLDRIWEAFVQVDASRTRVIGGSGLGLTISRHLARLMGGDITVRSEPGLGSAFVVWLPAAEPREVTEARESGYARSAPADDDALHEVPEQVLDQTDPASTTQLSDIADGLLSEVERILATYLARLRNDPEVPSASDLGDTQLEDHSATFIADLAQTLGVVGHDGPAAAEMLRDGTAIQRLIAARHGAQRARLGWSADEVRRELRILREELHAGVRRAAVRGGETDIERVIGLVNHFLEHAERETLRGFEAARAAAPPRPSVPPPP
jgi:PAS domain S-box-containing protein